MQNTTKAELLFLMASVASGSGSGSCTMCSVPSGVTFGAPAPWALLPGSTERTHDEPLGQGSMVGKETEGTEQLWHLISHTLGDQT